MPTFLAMLVQRINALVDDEQVALGVRAGVAVCGAHLHLGLDRSQAAIELRKALAFLARLFFIPMAGQHEPGDAAGDDGGDDPGHHPGECAGSKAAVI
ncbi:MAG: hypothetical protein MUF16_19905 [Burkholderiaceae bacterium]|nr:hypothetical protein [Burkholderiaceae bacterium]